MDLDEALTVLKDPNAHPDQMYLARPLIARHLEELEQATESHPQIETRDGQVWRRTLHVRATDWVADNPEGDTQ